MYIIWKVEFCMTLYIILPLKTCSLGFVYSGSEKVFLIDWK